MESPDSPVPFLLIGVIVALGGFGLSRFDSTGMAVAGDVLAGLGATLLLVAAIAAGVEWGVRRARADRPPSPWRRG